MEAVGGSKYYSNVNTGTWNNSWTKTKGLDFQYSIKLRLILSFRKDFNRLRCSEWQDALFSILWFITVLLNVYTQTCSSLSSKEEGGIWHSISTCTRTLVKVLVVASCKFITIFMCLNYYKIVTCVWTNVWSWDSCLRRLFHR